LLDNKFSVLVDQCLQLGSNFIFSVYLISNIKKSIEIS
jgi:hypothetical protein